MQVVILISFLISSVFSEVDSIADLIHGFANQLEKSCPPDLQPDPKCHEQLGVEKWRYDQEREINKRNFASFERLAEMLPQNRAAIKPIDVVSVADLSVERFRELYANKKPVVITGLKLFTDKPWTLDLIREKCGDEDVYPFVFVPNLDEWGALQSINKTSVRSFIDEKSTSDKYLNEDETLQYLFDWSLPKYCPELLQNFIMPKYFAKDYLYQLPTKIKLGNDSENVRLTRGWPSLFVGPKGSRSGLHIDAYDTQFWMYLVSGEKVWHLFKKEDRPLLYEKYPAFEFDSFNEDFTRHPLAKFAEMYEHTQKGGELIYIPGATPHQVKNTEDIIALSTNFIDEYSFDSSVGRICRAIPIAGLSVSILGTLLETLQQKGLVQERNENILWSELDKNRPNFETGEWKKIYDIALNSEAVERVRTEL